MIVGYSLAHNQVFAPVFALSLELLPRVQELGFIEKTTDAIIGQKCLKHGYLKGGLMAKMDKILYTHLSKDFKFYFASVSLSNGPSLNFVATNKYQKVFATDARVYFVAPIQPTELNEESYRLTRPDGEVIGFRFATMDDIPGLTELNKEWMAENLTDLSSGYLGAMFSADNWAYMIARKWVVLAETDRSPSLSE